MSINNVEKIIENIREDIKIKNLEFDRLLDFLAMELSKLTLEQKETVPIIVDNIKTQKFTKNEITQLLYSKLDEINNSHDEKQSLEIAMKSPSNVQNEMAVEQKTILNRLKNNKDLTVFVDNTLHFNKRHLSFLSRILYRQITQNYLSALKWYITNDFVTQQSKFNLAVEESTKIILNTFNKYNEKIDVSIFELKNYANESEKWIQNIETKLEQMSKTDGRIASIETKLEQMSKTDGRIASIETKLEQMSKTDGRIASIETKINENFNELKEFIVTRDLKTTNFLLSKIEKIALDLERVNTSIIKTKNGTK